MKTKDGTHASHLSRKGESKGEADIARGRVEYGVDAPLVPSVSWPDGVIAGLAMLAIFNSMESTAPEENHSHNSRNRAVNKALSKLPSCENRDTF